MGHIIKNVCVLCCPVISNVVKDLIYSVNVSEVLVQCLSVGTCIRSAICNLFFSFSFFFVWLTSLLLVT